LVKAGFRSTTGYSGFVDAVMSVFIAWSRAAWIPPVMLAAAAETADLVARRSWKGALWPTDGIGPPRLSAQWKKLWA
jgi:hypothetical protein